MPWLSGYGDIVSVFIFYLKLITRMQPWCRLWRADIVSIGIRIPEPLANVGLYQSYVLHHGSRDRHLDQLQEPWPE